MISVFLIAAVVPAGKNPHGARKNMQPAYCDEHICRKCIIELSGSTECQPRLRSPQAHQEHDRFQMRTYD